MVNESRPNWAGLMVHMMSEFPCKKCAASMSCKTAQRQGGKKRGWAVMRTKPLVLIYQSRKLLSCTLLSEPFDHLTQVIQPFLRQAKLMLRRDSVS